jgi:hypothetical protein
MKRKFMIRVFPRKTSATPIDDLVYFEPPGLFRPSHELPVMVSCTFTYDKSKAEYLARQWEVAGYKVYVGGPAYDDKGDIFVTGRFLKNGYVITSRGCNNNCWFCYTPKREGKIRELPIRDGWNVLDSNLLQCGEMHIRKVFDMLKRQSRPISFSGGLEAKIIKDWHIDLLSTLTIARIYMAYDTPDDYEPLVMAAKKLINAGIAKNSHKLMCYVLIGYQGDTLSAAEKRCEQVLKLKLTPFAMRYKNERNEYDPMWTKFQSKWANPYKIYGKKRE